MYNLRKFSAIL